MLSESEEIVGDAIRELNFTDAVAVVLGGEATVKKRYSTRIGQELGKTEALTILANCLRYLQYLCKE